MSVFLSIRSVHSASPTPRVAVNDQSVQNSTIQGYFQETGQRCALGSDFDGEATSEAEDV